MAFIQVNIIMPLELLFWSWLDSIILLFESDHEAYSILNQYDSRIHEIDVEPGLGQMRRCGKHLG